MFARFGIATGIALYIVFKKAEGEISRPDSAGNQWLLNCHPSSITNGSVFLSKSVFRKCTSPTTSTTSDAADSKMPSYLPGQRVQFEACKELAYRRYEWRVLRLAPLEEQLPFEYPPMQVPYIARGKRRTNQYLVQSTVDPMTVELPDSKKREKELRRQARQRKRIEKPKQPIVRSAPGQEYATAALVDPESGDETSVTTTTTTMSDEPSSSSIPVPSEPVAATTTTTTFVSNDGGHTPVVPYDLTHAYLLSRIESTHNNNNNIGEIDTPVKQIDSGVEGAREHSTPVNRINDSGDGTRANNDDSIPIANGDLLSYLDTKATEDERRLRARVASNRQETIPRINADFGLPEQQGEEFVRKLPRGPGHVDPVMFMPKNTRLKSKKVKQNQQQPLSTSADVVVNGETSHTNVPGDLKETVQVISNDDFDSLFADRDGDQQEEQSSVTKQPQHQELESSSSSDEDVPMASTNTTRETSAINGDNRDQLMQLYLVQQMRSRMNEIHNSNNNTQPKSSDMNSNPTTTTTTINLPQQQQHRFEATTNGNVDIMTNSLPMTPNVDDAIQTQIHRLSIGATPKSQSLNTSVASEKAGATATTSCFLPDIVTNGHSPACNGTDVRASDSTTSQDSDIPENLLKFLKR